MLVFFGGVCPKSASSAASTPARVAQKADCTLKSGLFGQPGGGIYTFMICSALKEIHIYNPLLLKQAGFGHDVKVIME